MKTSFIILCTYCCFLLVTSCKDDHAQTHQVAVVKDSVSKKDITIPGNFSSQVLIKFDSTLINSFFKKYTEFKGQRKKVDSFYHNRKYAYAWFDTSGMIEPAANLFNRMENINEEGLPDRIPYKQDFSELMQNGGIDSLNKPSVFTELMLTAQYFFYAEKVWGGLNEQQTKAMSWFLPRKKVSYNNLLDSIINGKDILDSAPVYRQYGLLKNYLKRYRDIQNAGGFPVIKAEKKTYKKGDSAAAIASIRSFLFLCGDLSSNNKSEIFDNEMETAVKKFQQRMGEKEDGIIGPSVLKEMNTPIEARIEQIIVNMERSRWVPVSLLSNYFVVNIPEYKLHAYENNQLIWSMNVVVGQPAHKTVVFNGDIKYIVFSPYWNVPSGIFRKEVLPGIQRDKNYLAKHNMEWNGSSVRQKPGPNNSLGLVKFLFPNSYDIYLHDTPAKSLFGESNRAFSHGCIRVAEPQKLAEYLLRNDSSWTQQKIVAAMNAGVEKYVTLKQPEPVFIAYFTAFVDRDGKINFRDDVYGRDNRLAAMLLDKPALK